MSHCSRRLIGLAGISVVAGASMVVRAETLVVPADGTVVQSSELLSRVLYEITVEGTYTQALAGQQADAEWGQADPGGEWSEAPYTPPDPLCHPEHDLLIDEQEYHWMGTSDGECFRLHTYSTHGPGHVYKTYILGCDASISLRIQDVEYADNSGSLTVTIQPYRQSVPAVSEWGIVAMALLVLAVGTVVLMRQRAVRV